mgnify:CR=1 FL=1
MSWDKLHASPLLQPDQTSVCDVLWPVNITSDQVGQRHTDLAYIGGYLDGEGCFRAINTPTISVSNTYPYTLLWLQRLFGGRVRCRDKSQKAVRTCYEWAVYGEAARICIKMVLPFLWEKREQAQLLLDIYRYPAQSRRREKLLRVLSDLKHIDRTEARIKREIR